MHLNVPITSIDTLENRLSYGVKEIYFGVKDELYTNLSFTGRGNYGRFSKINLDKNEASYAVKYAHEHGALANILVNTNFFSNIKGEGGICTNDYLKYYVDSIMKYEPDAIVVGNIGILGWIAKQQYPVKIHASVFLNTQNIEQIMWLIDMGVSRVILPYQVTLREIKEMCAFKLMEIEIPGYKGCSFYNGMCSFLHEYSENKAGLIEIGPTCKKQFDICINSKNIKAPIFDVEKTCSLCKIAELNRIGVTTLKIVGRESSYNEVNNVIDAYQKKLDGKKVEIPKWWQRKWCSQQRCKFADTDIDKFTIGGLYE